MQKMNQDVPRLDAATQEFVNRMTAWHGISDGSLSARIVGEFSAGKTRLLSALLADIVPQQLMPVSSRDVQTRLPLEVTYGEQAALSLLSCPAGAELGATVVRPLTHFPARAELMRMELDPARHRLRLALPMEQLVLPNGDFLAEGKTPKRLFLIDMPGWNALDDDIAEDTAELQMAGAFNLALVYVVNASRLDSAGNKRRLAQFLEVLADAEFCGGQQVLLVVITHCGADESERERLQARTAQQVTALWRDAVGMQPEQLDLTVLGAEFDAMTAAQLQAFRQRFWQALLAPLGLSQQPGHPWIARIRGWEAAWQLAPKVAASVALLLRLRGALGQVRQGGGFMPGMNIHRLQGLDAAELLQKLQSTWQRRCAGLDRQDLTDGAAAIALDAAHPLGPWWAQCWQAQSDAMTRSARRFFDEADDALRGVSADTSDLALHLEREIAAPYADACAAVDGSFARLLDTLAAMDQLAPEKLLATLLGLVTLQMRFESARTSQMRLLAGEDA